MDAPGGELVALGTSAPLALKVLGPTADYVGQGLQSWTENRVNNVRAIFEIAGRKLGDKLDSPGEVPPRMVKEVLDEGSYRSDELGVEYFGGLLASSRTGTPRDDRSAALASLVGRLSIYQLRSHYVIYAYAQRLLAGTDVNLSLGSDRQRHARVFIPFDAWVDAMGFDTSETLSGPEIWDHCHHGLMREQLLNKWWMFGSGKHLTRETNRIITTEGMALEPSVLGVELFSSAHGLTGSPEANFLDPEREFEIESSVNLLDGAALVHTLPQAGT